VLSLVGALRNRDVKSLDLLAASGEAHFEFEAIVIVEILAGAIERNEADSSAGKHCLTLVALSVARRTMTVPCSGATERRIAGSGPAAQSARILVNVTIIWFGYFSASGLTLFALPQQSLPRKCLARTGFKVLF
jgi:hypothetical protein